MSDYVTKDSSISEHVIKALGCILPKDKENKSKLVRLTYCVMLCSMFRNIELIYCLPEPLISSM